MVAHKTYLDKEHKNKCGFGIVLPSQGTTP